MQVRISMIQDLLDNESPDQIIKKLDAALAGVAQRTECQPTNQRVTGLIPSQGMSLGCRPGPK